MTRLVLFLSLLTLGTSATCFAQLLPNYPPTEIGYVTRVSSPTDFDVDGYRLVFNSKSTLNSESARHGLFDEQALNPFLGDRASVWGKRQKKSHTISVRQIVLRRAEPREVSGFALIQQVAPYSSPTIFGAILVQADGYPILVSSKTTTTFVPPLTSLSGIHSNMWIVFHGQQQLNGIVIADKAGFEQNVVSDDEDRMRTKKEYDPAAVDPDAGEDPLKKFFLGADPKKIPPYIDEAMQKRVNRIGTNLVPKFQRDLSDTDPTKIHFRFQLVDEKRWYDAWTLPNGIILVPRQLVERLENDSQLATVLADNIACALEKQSFRQVSTAHTLTAVQIAGIAGGIFVPGLGIATNITTAGVASSMKRHAVEQSGRVSLYLMHEAGYDINEAPRTWWLLSSKKDIPEASLPERATYLYQTLGTTWPPATATSDSTSSTHAEMESVP